MSRIAIIGAGAWGTSLSIVLGRTARHQVRLWAYEKDVPRTSFELGHSADAAPPLPWTSRAFALQRNKEIEGMWVKARQASAQPESSSEKLFTDSSARPR